MHITSLQNPLVKDAAALQQKKYRDETGLFLVEGAEPCRDALARGWACVRVFVLDDPHPGPLPGGERGQSMPRLKNTPSTLRGEGRGEGDTLLTTTEILAKISRKDNPQDVIGVFRQRVAAAPAQADFILALEEIRDPGNLGTIMRTAHAVGVAQIALVGPCCDAFAPEVIRASMGSFSAVNLCAMDHAAFIVWHGQSGMTLLGTDVGNAVDYRAQDYRHAVLVMGNEQKGLSAALKTNCTGRVHIPMPGGTESLNLGVATSLLLYQAGVVAQQRN